MRANCTASVIIAVAGLFCLPSWVLAQTATNAPLPHVPLQKTIGQTTKSQPQVYPSLIVFNSHGASLQGGKLTLTGVSPNAIVFADRPVRAAGHDFTENLLEPIRKLLESNESDVIPYWALDSFGSARCGSLNTAVLRIATAFVIRVI